MAQRADQYLKVTVTFERRDDGGLRVWSDDVPGLLLSNPDANAVIGDVIPALETLFKHNRHMDVQFAPVTDVHSYLKEAGVLPETDRETREYAAPVELPA